MLQNETHQTADIYKDVIMPWALPHPYRVRCVRKSEKAEKIDDHISSTNPNHSPVTACKADVSIAIPLTYVESGNPGPGLGDADLNLPQIEALTVNNP